MTEKNDAFQRGQVDLTNLTCHHCGYERTTLAYAPVAAAICLAPRCGRWEIGPANGWESDRDAPKPREGAGLASFRDAAVELAIESPDLNAALFYTLGGRHVEEGGD